jgi:palmitoyl-protein thioesterase
MAFPLLLLLLPLLSHAYKPVIMMHGVGSGAGEMSMIAALINTTHPGTIVTSLPLYEGKPASWDHDLNTQVEGVTTAIRKLVSDDPTSYSDGYHLVCKSQGGLICRCVIESMDDHNVVNFVSLAGPQEGVFGTAYFETLKRYGLPEWLIKGGTDLMYLVAYNFLGQKISVANIWRDPNHLSAYDKGNTFLPKYTSQATPAMKANVIRLKKAVFCVGSGKPFDGGIEPWQTGAWGSYDSSGHMVNMTNQTFYTEDTFGLKTLDTTGRLNLTVVPGVSHGDWTGDEEVIKKYVLPHCT